MANRLQKAMILSLIFLPFSAQCGRRNGKKNNRSLRRIISSETATKPCFGYLDLSRKNLKDLKCARNYPKRFAMRRLDLSNNKKLADISHITDWPNLQELDLSGCDNIKDLSPIFALSKLREVSLHGIELRNYRKQLANASFRHYSLKDKDEKREAEQKNASAAPCDIRAYFNEREQRRQFEAAKILYLSHVSDKK